MLLTMNAKAHFKNKLVDFYPSFWRDHIKCILAITHSPIKKVSYVWVLRKKSRNRASKFYEFNHYSLYIGEQYKGSTVFAYTSLFDRHWSKLWSLFMLGIRSHCLH